MEEFTSPNLQLILGVKEGTNFDRVQKPTVIIATLNGHALESKKIQPDCNPQYATDLTWETDKNALRKMRCNQTPIKVECYAVNENGSREKLGYILLSVRCAQIIHRDKESSIKTNWHNILGVRNDFNTCKPKLLLYLIIKEKDNKSLDAVLKHGELHQLASISLNVTPVWLQDEHLIQLGPLVACHDIFLLTIIAQSATDINQQLYEFKESVNEDLSFVYNILDTNVRLKPFRLESDSVYLNEKIILKIRTSLPVLLNYLNTKPHFFIKLKNNNITIGQSEVNLKSLINTSCLQEFKQINKSSTSTIDHYCIFKSTYLKENKGDYRREDNIDQLLSLKIHIELQHMESKDVSNDQNISYCHNSPQLHRRAGVIPLSNQPNYSERQINHMNKYIEGNLENSDKYNNRIPYTSPREKVHFSEVPQTHNTHSILHKNDDNKSHCINDYRNYSLSICLNTIKFLESRPDVKNIEFRFYNPQGDIITSVCNNISITAGQIIDLQNVKCKLHFVSTSNGIGQLLTAFAPKINICDATSHEIKCIAQVLLDIKKMFNKKQTEVKYEASLIDCHSHKEIGCTGITAILKDNISSNTVKKEIQESPLDNSLAYKIVDELETWKERQKEIFKDELRKKEEAHLTLLNEEWQRRRECLESKLACSVQQCKTLANNLNKTTENLRLRKIQSLEKETKLIQANEELQWKYDRKLHQLQEALTKMQEEFSTKLMNLEEQNRNLLSQIEILKEKNYDLEKIKIEQAEKLEAYQKASLTKDQTASVLQQLKNLEEKLDNAQKSKFFFKEQWGKAVKEIHRIKMENQHAIESQIKNNKEELDNLNLEEILHADSTALTYDQIALNQIQREIDIMNPETNLQYFDCNINEQLFSPKSELCLNYDKNYLTSDISTNTSASDKRLHMLIEERDSLLKTGTYTSEDSVIIKLNAEIRSILMNS